MMDGSNSSRVSLSLVFLSLVVLVSPVMAADGKGPPAPPAARTGGTDSAQTAGDPLDHALNALGLSRGDLHPDPLAALLSPRSDLDLAVFRRLLLRPTEAPYYVGVLSRRLEDWSFSPHRTLIESGALWDSGIARGYANQPLSPVDRLLVSGPDPLVAVLSELERSYGLPEGELLESASGLEEVPEDWRREIARLAAAGLLAVTWHQRAFREIDPSGRQAVLRQVLTGAPPESAEHDLRGMIEDFDRASMMGLALDMGLLLEDFIDFCEAQQSPPPFLFELQAPTGLIRVTTLREDDIVSNGPVFLSVDWYGDETYAGTGGDETSFCPASLLIDWSGDDTYAAEGDQPGPGAGVFGVGVLYDRAGSDEYSGKAFCSAAALFGVSLLIDCEGDDRHVAVQQSQGSATAGLAVLMDRSGEDRYESVHESQAFGGPAGVGLLLDQAGSDRYELLQDPLLYPSPQDPRSNTSAGQGCGMGSRNDLSDGRSVPGGLGLLIDLAGDDTYRAGVFAQGCGFWRGAGVLLDEEGDDLYEGVWYVQGASAHQAVGLLVDRRGGDRYECTRYMGQGAGHDYGSALLVELDGDDQYRSGSASLGSSGSNSLSLFLEAAGADTYELTGSPYRSFGAARLENWGSMREDILGVALFLDLGGQDEYKVDQRAEVGNTREWRGKQTFPDLGLRSELGFGLDWEEAPVPIRTGPVTEPLPNERQLYDETVQERRSYRSERFQDPSENP